MMRDICAVTAISVGLKTNTWLVVLGLEQPVVCGPKDIVKLTDSAPAPAPPTKTPITVPLMKTVLAWLGAENIEIDSARIAESAAMRMVFLLKLDVERMGIAVLV